MSQNPTDLFSENPPSPVKIAPARPAGEPSGPSAAATAHIAEVTARQKTAGSLAAQIAAAKAAATFPFALTRTAPGQAIEVIVKRPSLMYLATSGRLPMKLQTLVGKMFNDDANAEAISKEIEKAASQDLPLIGELIDANAIEGFVDPRLVPNGQAPGPDELNVGDIDFEDKMDFFSWCNGGADEESDALAEFPAAGQIGDMEPVPAKQAGGQATFGNTEAPAE